MPAAGSGQGRHARGLLCPYFIRIRDEALWNRRHRLMAHVLDYATHPAPERAHPFEDIA